MTEIVVTPADERPAAPGSPLAGLRERRARSLAALHLDLKVPRWDDDGGPAIYVRYAPASTGRVTSAMRRREAEQKKWGDDWLTVAQADVLIHSCIEVYATDDGGTTKYSLRPNEPLGEKTKFDPDLAASLGLTDDGKEATAVDVVRALYLTDGDLLLAYQSLLAWSGDVSTDLEEQNRGN